MKNSLIISGIILSSLCYIFLIDTADQFVLLITKLIPMILIILYAALQPQTPKSILTGLFLCAVGDALIIFSFLPGLAAFLIGHLFYIYAFIKKWHFSWTRLSIFIPLVFFGTYMGNALISSLKSSSEEAFILPVLIYLVIISVMGFTAFQTGNKHLYFGSLLFMVSDTVLAWNMFIGELHYSSEIIMLTYYSAQFLIARSNSKYPQTLSQRLV